MESASLDTNKHAATRCNTLQDIRVCCVAPRQSASLDTRQHTETYCNTLKHTAPHNT